MKIIGVTIKTEIEPGQPFKELWSANVSHHQLGAVFRHVMKKETVAANEERFKPFSIVIGEPMLNVEVLRDHEIAGDLDDAW